MTSSVGAASPVLRTSGLPRFEASASCQPGVSRCGYVVVPERHARPDGPAIRLAVEVYERTNREMPSDPVIYVQGGPGQKWPIGAGLRTRFIGAVRRNHDVILYDQRGVGQSQPALDCPELDVARLADAKQGTAIAQRASAQRATAVVQCRDRLVSAGVDLAAYATAESAADLDDIRATLGYDRANLVGISYGTYLAQATMRAFPQRIRSVVLDSVVPLDAPTGSQPTSADADAMLEQIFVLCAADPACGQAFPRLRDTHLQLVARLEGQPALVRLSDPGLGAVLVDATRFGSALLNQMADWPGGVLLLIATVDRVSTFGSPSGSRDQYVRAGLSLKATCSR